MTRENISDQQGIALIFYIMFGSTLQLFAILQYGRIAWMVVVVGALLGLIMSRLYIKLYEIYRKMDLFDMIEKGFGPLIGKMIQVIYTVYFIQVGALVLREFGDFIVIASMPEIPVFAPLTALIILCMWAVKEGLEVLGRISEFFMVIGVIAVVLTALLLIPQMNINYILPLFDMDRMQLIKGGYRIFAFPFGEMILLTMFFPSLKFKQSPMKIFTVGILLSMGIILILTLVDILVLSPNINNEFFFPTYNAVSRINIGNFIQRLEILDGALIVINGFIKVSICLLATTKGLVRVFNFRAYRFMVVPVGLVMVTLAHISFDNIIESSRWLVTIFPIFSLPFQVLIPLLLLLRGYRGIR